MTYIIKTFFIFFYSSCICLKMINRISLNKLIILLLSITSITFATLSYIFNNQTPAFKDIIPLLLFWIFISLYTNKPKESFITTTLSFAISYGLHALSSVIALIIIFPLYNDPRHFPYFALATLTSFLHTITILFFLRIKRLQKGIPFLFSTPIINISTTVCLCFIGCLIFFKQNRNYINIQFLTLLSFLIVLAFLIHWWQAQITKSYKRSLEQRELESLRIELQEKDKTIAKLKAENVRLGDVTHEYNKLIPPLAAAVCEYLEGDFADTEMMRSKGQALSAQFRAQSEKLAQTTALVNAKKYQQHDSGIDNLNPYLNSFEKQAVSGNIEFSVHTAVNLREQLPKNLSVDDFVHLVVNLLSNAFIAVADCANPVVQLQFYQVGKHFVIEVSDNGIPFEIESLVNFGLERITTHADTGGSGVGLVAIWEMKEACGATLHIEEYASGVPFSKKISLIFNKKNLYSIRTWRKEEILQKSKRIDLQVYDFEK